MSDTKHPILKAVYWLVALFFALGITGMTFISDGPVSPVVHVMAFVIVLVIFGAVPATWRFMNNSAAANGPFKRNDHE